MLVSTIAQNYLHVLASWENAKTRSITFKRSGNEKQHVGQRRGEVSNFEF